MVASAILALPLGLLIQIFSRALHTTALSGDYSRAATLAQARLNAVGIDIPLEPGSHGGDAQDDFSWQVSIAPYEFRRPRLGTAPGCLPGYLGGILERQGGQGDKQRRISLTSLRLADPSADTDPGIGAASPSKSRNKTR